MVRGAAGAPGAPTGNTEQVEVTSPANPMGLHLGQPELQLWPSATPHCTTARTPGQKLVSSIFKGRSREREPSAGGREKSKNKPRLQRENCELTSDSADFTAGLQGDPDRPDLTLWSTGDALLFQLLGREGSYSFLSVPKAVA